MSESGSLEERTTNTSTSSSYTSSISTKRKEKQKKEERRKRRNLLREQKLFPSGNNEILPGYAQGKILGQGSFGSVWTLVKDESGVDARGRLFLLNKGIVPVSVPVSNTTTTTITTTTTTTTTTTVTTASSLSPFQGHENVSSNWILKVSSLLRDRDGRLKDTFDREVFYLKHLSNVKPKMVPKLLYDKVYQKNGLQVMERYDDTVKSLGLAQAKQLKLTGRTSQAFTWKQLKKILDLALRLDKMGILHGDLKHSNMLFRWTDSDPNNVEICVCDFGFTGTTNGEHYYPLVGFMRHYGCNPKRTIHYESAMKSSQTAFAGGILQPRFKLSSPIPNVLMSCINRCQLYIALAEQTRLYIWHENQYDRIRPKDLLKMMYLDKADIIETFRFYCPKMRTLPTPSLSRLYPISHPTSYMNVKQPKGAGGSHVETKQTTNLITQSRLSSKVLNVNKNNAKPPAQQQQQQKQQQQCVKRTCVKHKSKVGGMTTKLPQTNSIESFMNMHVNLNTHKREHRKG